MLMHDAIDSSQREITRDGYMSVPAVFARSGIYEYTAAQVGAPGRDATDVIRVWRPSDEVFKQASMDSFGRKPVTLDHPSKPVTLSNFKEVAVGMSDPGVTRDGDLLCGTLLITDQGAIAAIDGGKKELSNGYSADYDFTPGITPSGDAYDAIQRNMSGNHIAIVDRGRCGHQCAIADNKETGMPKLVKVTIDGEEVEVPASVAKALSTAEAQRDTAVSDGKKAAKRATDAETKLEELDEEEEELDNEGNPFSKKKSTDKALAKKLAKVEAQRDVLEASAMTADQMDAAVETRSVIVTKATRLMGNEFSTKDAKGKSKSNAEIMREVVTDKVEMDVTDKNEDYIEATFDLLGQGGGEANRFAGRNLAPGKRKTTDTQDVIATAREKCITDTENRWKTPEAKAS